MKYSLFIHIHGSKLYGTNIIGHILYEVLKFPNGLKTSVAKPSLTLQASDENSRYIASNDFQAFELVGYLKTPSSKLLPYAMRICCYFL